ncbi:uncharacterized protein LOC112591046 [Melanaphis sacchari]|uniref:uncharacterized protein LOC112591046 n=1 Tax=Melanaphis sacchari TaxID=742174 RepID=UPI000DC14978|nr:uncharacterized protein LOC112591046 [Melanaphis sacchari]
MIIQKPCVRSGLVYAILIDLTLSLVTIRFVGTLLLCRSKLISQCCGSPSSHYMNKSDRPSRNAARLLEFGPSERKFKRTPLYISPLILNDLLVHVIILKRLPIEH